MAGVDGEEGREVERVVERVAWVDGAERESRVEREATSGGG